MSLDLEERLKVFLASSPQRIAHIQVVQISHSALSQTFTLWNQPFIGAVTIGGVEVETEPCNLQVKVAGSEGNLDQKFDILIDTTDINDRFRDEMKRVPLGTAEKVAVKFYEYLSDDLTQAQSQAVLQVESISYQLGQATISAASPRLNVTSTGVRYLPRDIPMLRGLL